MKDYSEIVVESFIPEDRSNGLHGLVHVRPLAGQHPFSPDMHVQCSKDLSDIKKYEVGTKFLIKAKITSREGGRLFIYSSYKWPYTVCK